MFGLREGDNEAQVLSLIMEPMFIEPIGIDQAYRIVIWLCFDGANEWFVFVHGAPIF